MVFKFLMLTPRKKLPGKPSTEPCFKDKEVEKVIIVNREVAQIFLKESALDKEEHKSVSQKPFGSSTNKGPHYFFQISSPDNFENKLQEVQLNFDDSEKVEIKVRHQKRFYR